MRGTKGRTSPQFLPRIFFRQELIELRIARQQHARLDVDERGRHVDELRAQFDIHLRGLLHVFQILLRDPSDGDVVNVDLLLPDQVQQQVQRAIVLLEVKIQRGRHFYSGYQSVMQRFGGQTTLSHPVDS